MKVIIYFNIPKNNFKDPKDYDGLSEIFIGDPDGSGLYEGKLDKQSPVLAAIFNRFHVLGFKPWTDMSRQPLLNEFQVQEDLKLDRKDFLKAPYMIWFSNHSLGEVAQTNDAGQIILNLDPVDMGEVEPRTKKALFTGALPLVEGTNETLVSDSFRKTIEEAGLVGIKFEDRVKLTGELAGKVPEKYWVLRSCVLLPAYSNQTKWVDKQRQPCGPDAPGANIPLGELPRYDASVLAPLEPFDLGLAQRGTKQNLLMSQRFYQLCLKHKIPVVVVLPVEVVPG